MDDILIENIRITAQVITEICQRNTRKNIGDGSLSRNQFYILKILYAKGELPIGEFARLLDISPAAASKNIDRLANLGTIGRQNKPGDRRSQFATLLPDGRHLVEEFNRITKEKMTPLMDQFTPDEKVMALNILRRISSYTLADGSNPDLICYQCNGNCGEECAVGTRGGVCLGEKETS